MTHKDTDETLPQDTDSQHDMSLGFRIGRIGGLAQTMVVWTDESYYPADIAHRALWKKLVDTYSALMDSFQLYDPSSEVQSRWELVKDYVINGGDLDANLFTRD
jgi:hypothetical protein